MPATILPKAPARNWVPFLSTAGLLVVILGILFHKSFIPREVVFSNDGPLAGLVEQQNQLPQIFTGMWADLNSIGSNSGIAAPGISSVLRLVLGPVGYAKFYAPFALFILGIGAWAFFRQLKLTPLAAILGAIAAMLASTFFSDACWGVASHQIAFGLDFLALALIVSNAPATPWFVRWTRLALAGFAVGMNVIEAADIGAIFSLFVAAFTLFHAFTEDNLGGAMKRIGRGVGRTVVVALFAGFIAAQTVISLVGTQIKGIVGTQQNAETKQEHWNWTTQWSLPKIETLGIVVPGLFGYRMDTPGGGNYWGAVGRDAAWENYIATGEQGPAPDQDPYIRSYGTGNYAGLLVLLVAGWAIAQSFRRQNSIFSAIHRRLLWFWTAVLIVCLLLAYGRHAPFYRLAYALPYFSTIRNPIKYLFVFSWALVTVFAYGIHGLNRRYMQVPAAGSVSMFGQVKTWWAKSRGFDRNWTSACIVILIGSLLAWLIYALQEPKLAAYLQTVGFSDKNTANPIATFSVHQLGWFILFFALALVLLTLILSGAFAGHRAKWGGFFLGALLVADLGRADLPWIIYWDYPQKYASNPIVDILRDKPYEHRVADLRSNSLFENLYRIEWTQQLFPYYNIQSSDVVQMPRMPVDLAAYQGAFAAMGASGLARQWVLTDTRYFLGPAAYLDSLNQELDPEKRRFRIVQRFNIVPKPEIAVPSGISPERFAYYLPLDKVTAVPTENGDYALFEFTGALPRAKLYSDWQVSAGDPAELQQWVKKLQQQLPEEMGGAIASLGETDLATLHRLVSPDFDAWKTVLVSAPLPASPATNALNENPGTVEFKSYAPKDIVFTARANAPSVLLLNDKYDPAWRVWVDGKPAALLRCNFIMRGVHLTPGDHTVEFKFSLPMGPFYLTLSAIGVGILLCGFLFFSTRRTRAS